MTPVLKRILLVYFLFLFTTISGNSIRADVPLPLIEGKPAVYLAAERQLESEFRKEKFHKGPPTAPEVREPLEAPNPVLQRGVTPAIIEIPAIGVRAEVVPVGQTAEGQMEVPKSIYTAGWYEPGAKPGQNGNAVMAGHVDGMQSPGIFYHLDRLKAGDQILVMGSEGEKLTFTVTGKEKYLPEAAPLMDIFGSSKTSGLNLITCSGPFDRSTGHYEERLVVYAELTEQNP